MSDTIHNFKEKVNVLSENFIIEENENGVIIQGLALTFEKPTRNRVSYTTESGKRTHKTLIGKPFLDSHTDESIHKCPPFGHVIECWMGENPKNGLPALYYKADIDPEEKDFIRKAKRGDITGVSVQVLVDSVIEKQDMYGDYIQANIREFLELSAVLIPGDGDTTIKFIEKVNKKLNTNVSLETMDTSNGSALIGIDGVKPKSKTIRKDPETEKGSDDEKDTIKSKIYTPDPFDKDNEDDKEINPNQTKRLIGKKMEQDNTIDTNKYEELYSKMEALYEKISSKIVMDDKKDKEEEDKTSDDSSMKKIESLIRQAIKEELKGSPERETSDSKKGIGPDNTSSIPQTNQPANGEAPSGGSIYGNDNKATDEAEDAISKTKKPKSDYNKPAVKKNSLDDAKILIDQAKEIMIERMGEDVFKPKPGKTSEEPEPMDMKSPKESDITKGKTEMMDEEKEEDEKSKEKCGDYKESVSNLYNSLKEEISKESSRKSIKAMPTKVESKSTFEDSVKEYLNKINFKNNM